MTDSKTTMALGFMQAADVDEGPFANVSLICGGELIEGTAYIATDDKGNPVSLAIRVLLDDASMIGLLRKYVPIRGKTWMWGDGSTQPLGGGRSRWTVGGPKVTTRKASPVAASQHLKGKGGDMLDDIQTVSPVAPRGRLTAAQSAVCTLWDIDAATLRGLAKRFD